MNFIKDVQEVQKELSRKKKLSIEDRLFEAEVSVEATDVAIRGVLELLERDFTKLAKRVEKLENGLVNIPTEFDVPSKTHPIP